MPCENSYGKLLPLVLQKTEYTCGAACVVSLVKHLQGKNISEARVAKIFGTTKEIGTLPDQMVAGLGKLGIAARVEENLSPLAIREGMEKHRNYILLVESGGEAHWVAIAGIQDQKFILMDPWMENEGYQIVSPEELIKIWDTLLNGKKTHRLGITID